MKTVFKNFIYTLRKFKTSSILNILGLTAGIYVFLVLSMQIYYDLCFDRNFENAEDIYLLTQYNESKDEHALTFNWQFIDQLKEKAPEANAYVATSLHGNLKIYPEETAPEEAITLPLVQAKGDFETVFTPKVLEGDFEKGIKGKGNLVLSQKTAKLLFGNNSAIGKVLIEPYNKESYVVQAVIEDYPDNCLIPNGAFAYLPENTPNNTNYNVFIRATPKLFANFKEFMDKDKFFDEDAMRYFAEHPEQQVSMKVIPLIDCHLHFPTFGEGSYNTLLSLVSIAVLILFIAFINYLNFSLAIAPIRVKTFKIQQILGQDKGKQRILIFFESILFSIIAIGIAILLITYTKGSIIGEFFSSNLSITENKELLIFLGVIILAVSLIVSIYPTINTLNFNGVQSGNAQKGVRLRRILIIVQFTSAIILIISTLFLKKQYDYVVNYDWGMEKENILYIHKGNYDLNYNTLGDKLKGQNTIKDYTYSQFTPGYVGMSWRRSLAEKQIFIYSWPVYSNYMDFFGVPIIHGKNFKEFDSTPVSEIIVNEKLLSKYDLKPEEVLGKDMYVFSENAVITGIAKDVNFQNLRNEIAPMLFLANKKDDYMGLMFFKIDSKHRQQAVQQINTAWKEFTGETGDLQYLDERLNNLYKNENNLGKLVSIFSLIAIVIAIMGVYGIITFNCRYREREIAIRKVNGATEQNILILLNKQDVLIPLLISFIIACPISYWFVDKWLDNFAYRTDISWWIFALAGVLIFLITLVAVSWQSYRAAIKNPVESLKIE